MSPDLEKALQAYAAAYEAEYGKAEAVTTLIPYMLASVLESDRAFQVVRRK